MHTHTLTQIYTYNQPLQQHTDAHARNRSPVLIHKFGDNELVNECMTQRAVASKPKAAGPFEDQGRHRHEAVLVGFLAPVLEQDALAVTMVRFAFPSLSLPFFPHPTLLPARVLHGTVFLFVGMDAFPF